MSYHLVWSNGCFSYIVFYVSRISIENPISAGLWYGTTKADMSLFMKPLAEALKHSTMRVCTIRSNFTILIVSVC